jgi:phenylacetate-CoA ligase
MSTQIILKVLALRHRLRQRDRWTHRRLEAQQAGELRVQGRAGDVLRFPATSGGQVMVQPLVFHRVMDGVPAGGWQVAQKREELNVLLSGVREGFADATLVDSLRRELESQGALVPPVKVRRVPAIPRTTVGKAPLIKSEVHAGTLPHPRPGSDSSPRPRTGSEVGS